MKEEKNIYVGNRYVPKIMGEWNKQESYEGLSIVTNKGNSFTSKKRVPIGVELSNENYWVVTGNYNAQIENYRNDVKLVKENMETQKEEVKKQIGKLILNINDFGAVGDGFTDDTTAIQNAINECSDRGGGDVIIPFSKSPLNSPYIFTTIVVKEHVRLRGVGGRLKVKDNTTTNSALNYYLIHNMDGLGGHYPNVTCLDLIVDGNGLNNTISKVADTITFIGHNANVINCDLKDSPDSGIMFSQVTEGNCINNTIDGGRDVGIYVNDGESGVALKNSIVMNNKISNFPNGGIALKRTSQRVIVTSNTISKCGNGITLEHASTTNDYSRNMVVSNNRLYDIEFISIILRESNHVLCIGNHIEEFGNIGIIVHGTSHSIITMNMIHTQKVKNPTNYSSGLLISDRDNGSHYNNIIGNNINIYDRSAVGLWLGSISEKPNNNNIIEGNVSIGSVGLRVDDSWSKNTIQTNVLNGDTFDIIYYSGAKNKLLNNTLVNKTVSGNMQDWENAQVSIGGYNLWVDSKGDLRLKVGEPTKDLDGQLVDKTPTLVTGNPMLDPKFIGQMVIDTANKRVYVSTGLTNLDWIRVDNV